MNLRDVVNNRYFEWLYNTVCEGRFADNISYRKLLMHLHTVEFRYYIVKDGSRAGDGIDLRYRFAYDVMDEFDNAERYLTGPCSVLEMMVALAIRCEETLVDDPRMGDRTSQWFWGMITSLGLGSMEDDNFDRQYTDEVIDRFLERRYERNGKGGLFTIRNCDEDLRKIEIWYQLCRYLNTIM